ncbi:MAG: cytidylyltransferase domain-containing protein [Candidatus Thorarchaeota archaeon]
MRIGLFITVRMASTRLPSKALLEIKGKPIIQHLINWIKRVHDLDEIILCTTRKEEDKELIEIARQNGIKWFQGSEDNIIERQLDAAKLFDIDFIINCEGDGIFYETKYINDLINVVRGNQNVYDVISTKDLPLGVNIYGYKRSSLEKVLKKTVETGWLELLCTDSNLNQGYLSVNQKHKSEARLTLDYQEDFDFFNAIFNEFDDLNFNLEDIIKILKQKPKLMEINKHIDEQYWNRFNRQKLRVLVIGLGSMGKRRIRNLRALGLKNITGYDLDPKEVDIKVHSTLKEAMAYEPNMMIISTPPANHVWYQSIAISNRIPFFTEASVISNGLKSIIEYMERTNSIGMPSCTMRFHPAIKKIKELIDTKRIGKPLTFTYHSGSYLPEWHPHDDITQYYAYDKKQGAAKEIVPFELEWLIWLFGDIKSLKSYFKETMNFGIDDIYQILIEFESGVIGHLLVDVVSRRWTRKIEIMGSEGMIQWDWNTDLIEVWKDELDMHAINYEISNAAYGYHNKITEQMYVDELNHFINVVQGLEELIYTLEDDLKILKILEDIEKDGLRE